MAKELQGKRVAFLATDMFEQVEFTEPWKAVKESGAQPELLSLEEGEIQGFEHYDKADTFTVDRKSTRLNSSHTVISYAVFCLKKKKTTLNTAMHSLPRQQPFHRI